MMPRRDKGKSKSKDRHKDHRKGKGSGSVGIHNCPGWADQYGNWNNGFPCPMWGGPGEDYCCGLPHDPYCCPEPKTVAPPEAASPMPLIAGAAAGVVLILLCVLLCFCCPCCPGRKWIKRTRKPKAKKDEEATMPVCQHCHATMTLTSQGVPDTLACGCEVGGPPGSHHFTGGEPDLVLHLYENPYVEGSQKSAHTPQHHQTTWTPVPGSDPDMHSSSVGGGGGGQFEEPPPYDKSLMSASRHGHEDGEFSPNLSPTTEETPMIHRLQSPSKLCMKTFRPLGGGTTSLSPLSGMLRTPREAMIDQSRRDSGILFDNEDHEQNSHKNMNVHELDEAERDEEQDTYHESIVVPKFNFQSLSLVSKPGALSGSLSHSRTSGLSGSRGRTRRSRSSVDSLELEHLDQLIESMNIQTEGLPKA